MCISTEKGSTVCVHTQIYNHQVDITTKMLLSHLSGIRHWKGGEEAEPSPESNIKPEFYLNTNFKSVEEALNIFKDDELLHKPGQMCFDMNNFFVKSSV